MEPGDRFTSFLRMHGSQSYHGLATSPRPLPICKLDLHLLLGGLVFAAYAQVKYQSGKRNVIPHLAHDIDHFERAKQSGQWCKLSRKYKMKPRARALLGPNTLPWCSLYPFLPFCPFGFFFFCLFVPCFYCCSPHYISWVTGSLKKDHPRPRRGIIKCSMRRTNLRQARIFLKKMYVNSWPLHRQQASILEETIGEYVAILWSIRVMCLIFFEQKIVTLIKGSA